MHKEPLVFLPGMMCDIWLFEHQLIDVAADRSVIFATITQGTTIAEIAKSVLRDAPAKFALAGLSMGGIVAMEILRVAPERLTKLALMDTNPLAETPQVAAGRKPQIIKAKTGQMLEVIRDEMKPNYLALGAKRLEVLNLVMVMALKLGPDVFISQWTSRQHCDGQSSIHLFYVASLIAFALPNVTS